MTTTTATGPSISTIGLGLAALLLIFLVLTGRPIPFISGYRAAFFVLLVIGMAMCAPAIGRAITSGTWTQPLPLIASAIGVVIVLLGIAVLLGAQVPLITGEREAFIALALLGGSKVALTLVDRML
jgi:hypothetical protein